MKGEEVTLALDLKGVGKINRILDAVPEEQVPTPCSVILYFRMPVI